MKVKVSKVLSCTRVKNEFFIVGQKGRNRYLYTQVDGWRDPSVTPFHKNKHPGIEVKLAAVERRLVEFAHEHLGIPAPKKPKKYYESREVAHIWANQSAPEGRCSANFSFNGHAIYSYGTCMARFIDNGKVQAVLVNTNQQYSVSTSKHQGWVRSAIPNGVKRFFLHGGRRGESLTYTPEQLRDEYVSRFNEKNDQDSKYPWVVAGDILRRNEQLNRAIEVCQFFGLPKHRLWQRSKRFQREVDPAREIVVARQNVLEERRKKREATQKAASIAHAKASAAAFIADPELKSYSGGNLLADHDPELFAQAEAVLKERNAAAIKEWQEGTSNYTHYSWPTMLRREGDEMVTSKHARVPIDSAERAYRFAVARRARGWHANGEQCEVGAYRLNAVNEHGVVAGCHRVSWEEIERFANAQGWKA